MERTDHTLTKLRQLIASPDFSGGGRMPPERSLATELGVGRRSLRRALEVLEREGRISRHQGRGTFINGVNGFPGDVGKESGPALVRAVAAVRAGTDLRANSAFANILDHTNPLEVIEVRLAIEPVMARLAAFRASQTEIAFESRFDSLSDLEGAMRDMAQAHGHREFMKMLEPLVVGGTSEWRLYREAEMSA